MPIRGIMLITVLVGLVAVVFRRELSNAVEKLFESGNTQDKTEEENDK